MSEIHEIEEASRWPLVEQTIEEIGGSFLVVRTHKRDDGSTVTVRVWMEEGL